VAIGQLAIAILVLFSYPLQVQPCRNCLDKVFHFGSTIDKHEDDAVEDDHATSEMSPLKHTVLTSLVVIGGFSIAFFVDNLELGAYSFHCYTYSRQLMVSQFCPLSDLQDRRQFRSSSRGCSTGRQVLWTPGLPFKGSNLTRNFTTADKGRPEQEQTAQLGGACAGRLWFGHSGFLVGRHFILANFSVSSDSPHPRSLSYNIYKVLQPAIGSGLV
jgi:hypothetical protein